MTSNFAKSMNQYTVTANGAVSLLSPDISGETEGRMSLFFKSVRGLDTGRLHTYLSKAASENIIDAFLLAFHIRDCRGGKGERELGRQAFIWLFVNYPEESKKVLSLIPDYGRWDDILLFIPIISQINSEQVIKNRQQVIKIFSKQLIQDRLNMLDGLPVSLCAKWAPTENSSVDRKHNLVRILSKKMSSTPKVYRTEYITPLRNYINIVESYMCKGRWDEIEYSKVPSCAMKRLKNAFNSHSPERYSDWKSKLVKNEVKVNASQLQPYELIREIRTKCRADEVCEAQWKVLEKNVEELGVLNDAVIVVDTSRSMHSPNFLPIDVAVSLGLIISNATKGSFHNHVITFHSNPVFVQIKDGSLFDRYKQIVNIPWGGSTNLYATFDMICNRGIANNLTDEDMPKKLFIISDMQFDCVINNVKTNFQVIDEKYKRSGYTRPQIIFWNVNGSSSDFPVTIRDDGTALISGFSPSIMKSVLNSADFSPYTILRKTLDDNRYDPIRTALVE